MVPSWKMEEIFQLPSTVQSTRRCYNAQDSDVNEEKLLFNTIMAKGDQKETATLLYKCKKDRYWATAFQYNAKYYMYRETLFLKPRNRRASTRRANSERSNKETFSCDNIVTTYFDSTGEWVAKCLAAKTVQEYIIGSGYRKPVFIITGLKVATNLEFGSEATQNANADTKVGVNVPQAPVTVGIEGAMNMEKNQFLGFQSSDIVVGFRVKKYQYKRESLFSRERKLVGEIFTKGAEMLDDTARPSRSLDEFEEIAIEEEIVAQREAEKQSSSLVECWVKRTRSSGLD
ncbi:hypothetical protein TRIATDRAFT_93597 [Trichoderma atroviride IMI 206040]|uniref:Uncharacterized protein n=1 Tax=Hypocrea atroviridis (strain ATCC 20476 / IMI 206040) TaxID=452589 RepID=G9NL05_HYPAI|nr:uncharacterized protein TRIATDRAFT_93597 [Trichoderma atroviride IMI 206040]EHK48573.1 hypothetical protein TRIATDRAFT_93597 [Trichoderma atroviride IMI 206040]